MQPRSKSREEPPSVIAEAMQCADVVVCPPQHSLTHTQARKRAAAGGVRIATMPGISLDMFENGPVTTDYQKVADLSRKVADILTKAKRVRVEKDGAVLECSLERRSGIASTGRLMERFTLRLAATQPLAEPFRRVCIWTG